jgi:YesN/AraC family two-component response regulator
MSLRVLIADDTGFVRELLIQQCESLGYIIVGEAANGQDAVSKAFSLCPDVVLMDLVMPVMNGFEAAEQIHAAMPQIDLVALSSLEDEDILQQSMARGFKAFLKKPLQRQQFIQTFQSIEFQRKGRKHA